MLALTVLTPLVGALALLPMSEATVAGVQRIKLTALVTSMLTMGLTVLVWLFYDAGVTGYQMTMYAHTGFSSMHLGVDGVSVYYVVLTGLLTPMCLLASWSNVQHSPRLFNVLQLVTSALLLSVFLQVDLLLFYISFESVLVPLFFTVGLWGGSPTRVRSAMLLFLYTLMGSLFMLLAIMGVYAHTGTLDMTILHSVSMDSSVQRILWVCFAIALAVKTPVVPVHVWLPRAHADAPLAGSMVLAGTVLKLATYGILRVLLPMMPDACDYYGPVVQVVGMVSLVYSSLATMRQGDMKSMVAYSSVAHMAVVVLGLWSNTLMGLTGAVFLSLAHGFVSPMLFMLVGGVLYDRFHSRSIRYYRGLAQMMPLWSIMLFIAVLANMGTPLTMNWIGEFMALAGVYQNSMVTGVVASSSIVLSACYSMWLFGRINAGTYSSYLSYTVDLTRRETAVVMPMVLFTLVLGVAPMVVMDDLNTALTGLLYQALAYALAYALHPSRHQWS